MVDASSLQCCDAQATLAQEQSYVVQHCIDEEFTVEEVLAFLPDIIKESFQYHLVILLTYPGFWRADMLTNHPMAIKEGDQYYFSHRLSLTKHFILNLRQWSHNSDSRFILGL